MKYTDNIQLKEYVKSLVGKHITFMLYSLDENDEPILDGNYDTLTGKLVAFENDKLYIDLEVIQDINHTECLYDIKASEVMEVIYNGLDEELVNAPSLEDYDLSQIVKSNTLFIHDSNSLRRTHLLQTLGNLIRNSNPEKGIVCITENNFDSGLEIYQYLDVFIIADIQNISEKEQLSEILDILYNNNKQIIVGSSKPMKEINGLPTELLNLLIKCNVVNIDESIVIESNLNPEFTFDNFILDENNKFAKETALRVVEQLGVIYNPLKIYGKNGSGKTHLLHAIGNCIVNNSNKSVLYITSKTFVEHYNTMDYKLFRQKYSKVDVLIIDDFHLFIGNQDVQREFFNIFTYRVLENDMQTIISSIEPIGKLKNIEEYIIRKINAYGLEVEIKE